MMLWLIICLFISGLFIDSLNSERRIVDGEEVHSDKPFVVYLVKAPKSKREYDAWICGGAIVSPFFILTSAACVEDVEYMYAISGYNKYVKPDQIKDDKCVSSTKKKITYTCVPRVYSLDYDKIEKWALVDIAVARVDTPYKFGEDAKEKYKHCSYAPEKIEISYEDKHRRAGVSVTTYGWGHTKKYRKPEDTTDYNKRELRLAHTKIMENKKCANIYKETNPEMVKIINKYMICTEGQSSKTSVHIVSKKNFKLKLNNKKEESGELEGLEGCDDYLDDTRKGYLRKGCKSRSSYDTLRNGTEEEKEKEKEEGTTSSTEVENVTVYTFEETTSNLRTSPGICQNDHGGPLTTHVNGTEMLVGVSSVFRINEDYECVGPFLFTGTHCNSKFLRCIIDSEKYRRNQDPYCNESDEERGFSFEEKTISWAGHPDGPAKDQEDY